MNERYKDSKIYFLRVLKSQETLKNRLKGKLMYSINNRIGYNPIFCANPKQVVEVATPIFDGHNVVSEAKNNLPKVISIFDSKGKFLEQSVITIDGDWEYEKVISSKGRPIRDFSFHRGVSIDR